MSIGTDPFDHDDTCGNCGGEGYVSGCWTEYECIDPESGCEFCMKRCDWCNPKPKPAATKGQASADLGKVLADAIKKAEQTDG